MTVRLESSLVDPVNDKTLLDDQSVKCWGRNTRGQLGRQHRPTMFSHHNWDQTRRYVHSAHGCTMACWGGRQPVFLYNNERLHLSIPSGRNVVSVDLGKYFTCVSYDNGSAACSGLNNEFQLGLGNTISSSTLQYVTGIDVDV